MEVVACTDPDTVEPASNVTVVLRRMFMMSPSVGSCSADDDTVELDERVFVTSVTCFPEGAATVVGTAIGARGSTVLLVGAFVDGGAEGFVTGGTDAALLLIPLAGVSTGLLIPGKTTISITSRCY